jgi:hypothetical protein
MKRPFHSWGSSIGRLLGRFWQEFISPSVSPMSNIRSESNNRAGRWPDSLRQSLSSPLPVGSFEPHGTDTNAKAPPSP